MCRGCCWYLMFLSAIFPCKLLRHSALGGPDRQARTTLLVFANRSGSRTLLRISSADSRLIFTFLRDPLLRADLPWLIFPRGPSRSVAIRANLVHSPPPPARPNIHTQPQPKTRLTKSAANAGTQQSQFTHGGIFSFLFCLCSAPFFFFFLFSFSFFFFICPTQLIPASVV